MTRQTAEGVTRPVATELLRLPDGRRGFACLGNQMGGCGDARARELTLAVRASLGA